MFENPEIPRDATPPDPGILGQLLLIQASMYVVPDFRGLNELVRHGLERVPGVQSAALDLSHEVRSRADQDPDIASGYEREFHADHSPVKEQDLQQSLNPQTTDNTARLRIGAIQRKMGWLVLKIEDQERFAPYKPHVRNLTNSIAMILENRLQAIDLRSIDSEFVLEITKRMKSDEELQENQRELEEMVEQRTGELQRTNEALTREIRERKRMEGVLKNSQEALEEKVAQRTYELTAANSRLQEIDQVRKMFIASMNHELRNPLSIIVGFTEILIEGESGELTELQRKQLSIVKTSSDHMLDLVNKLIDISKVEADQLKPSLERFDLVTCLKDVMDLLIIEVRKKGIVLSSTLPDTLFLTSDELRVRQVVMNLVSNAVKYTDCGEIEIMVRESPGKVTVAVKDSGPGIKEEKVQNLFNPFVRISEDGIPKKEGTGLGLYLSQKLAQVLGGEITVKSTFGEGSVFTFSLPATYWSG